MVQQAEQNPSRIGPQIGPLWASIGGQQPKAAAASIQQTFNTCRTNLATLAFVLVHNVQTAAQFRGFGQRQRPGASSYSTMGKAAVNLKSDKVEVLPLSAKKS